MAKELPQLKEEQPILKGGTVNSLASGYEAFGKTLASIGASAESKTEEMVGEQSNAMLMSSVSNVEQIKTDAQAKILQNPSQATAIYDQSKQVLDSVQSSAFVNDKDRSKLKWYISSADDSLKLNAIKTSVDMGQREMSFSYLAQAPDQMRVLQELAFKDHDKAEDMYQSMIGTLHGLVTAGAFTPAQAGAMIHGWSKILDQSQSYHTALQEGSELSAREFHEMSSTPLTPGTSYIAPIPTEQSTVWLTDHFQGDRNFQDARANIHDHQLPNMQTWINLKPAKQKELLHEQAGVAAADSWMRTGQPLPHAIQRLNDLNTKGKNLSTKERSEKEQLNYTLKKLKNGEMLDVMKDDAQGNAIMENFHRSYDALSNLYANETKGIDPANIPANITAKYNDWTRDLNNKRVNDTVAWAQARHYPAEFTQPISKAEINAVENSLKQGQDPTPALQILNGYSKQNKMYVVDAIKDPIKSMALAHVALAPDNVPHEDKLAFMIANQSGQVFESDKVKEDKGIASKPTKLTAEMYTAVSPVINLLTKGHATEDVRKRQSSLIQANLNYAKLLAAKDQNLNVSDYIGKASEFSIKSFTPQTGLNYIVNSQELPMPMSDDELYLMSEHVLHAGNKKLMEEQGLVNYERGKKSGPLTMVFSKGEFQAVDNDGNYFYSIPFTTDMHAFLRKQKAEREESIKLAQEAFGPADARDIANQRFQEKTLRPGFHHAAIENEQRSEETALPSPGQITIGNVDLDKLPRVEAENGKYSTVRTITIEMDGKTILLPTIIDGKKVSNKEAIESYKKTGKHLGIFDSEKSANAYDKKMHEEQGWNQ